MHFYFYFLGTCASGKLSIDNELLSLKIFCTCFVQILIKETSNSYIIIVYINSLRYRGQFCLSSNQNLFYLCVWTLYLYIWWNYQRWLSNKSLNNIPLSNSNWDLHQLFVGTRRSMRTNNKSKLLVECMILKIRTMYIFH